MNTKLNNIIQELLNLNLVNRKNFKIINKKTRDSNKIKVIQDFVSKVIFLNKNIITNKYYQNCKLTPKDIPTLKKNISFTKLNKSKKKLKLPGLDDDSRRYKYFKKYFKNKKILDFGCGSGGFLYKIKNAKKKIGIELNKNYITFIKKNFSDIIIKNNLTKILDNVDVVTMFHVLEHLPKQVEILKQLKNKLKKNGKIIIEVPHANDFLLQFKELKEFKNFTFWSEHLILHTEESLKKILTLAGFEKIKIIYFQRYNFNNHMGWFIKKKPGGHDFFKNLANNKFNESYNKFLIQKKSTDTLLAIGTSI